MAKQRLELARYLRQQGVWKSDEEAARWLREWPEFLNDYQFKILIDDDRVFIVDKPFFVRVDISLRNGQLKRKWSTELSAADIFLQHNPTVKQVFLCHQLDYATSGILIFAKSPRVARSISIAFAKRKVQKVYAAIVYGRVDESTNPCVSGEIVRFHCEEDPPFKMKVVADTGKECLLTARIRKRGWLGEDDVTELELKPITGRRHQLRLFCTYILGHPILGDTTYAAGGPIYYRMCLHAEKLSINNGNPYPIYCETPYQFGNRIVWENQQS